MARTIGWLAVAVALGFWAISCSRGPSQHRRGDNRDARPQGGSRSRSVRKKSRPAGRNRFDGMDRLNQYLSAGIHAVDQASLKGGTMTELPADEFLGALWDAADGCGCIGMRSWRSYFFGAGRLVDRLLALSGNKVDVDRAQALVAEYNRLALAHNAARAGHVVLDEPPVRLEGLDASSFQYWLGRQWRETTERVAPQLLRTKTVMPSVLSHRGEVAVRSLVLAHEAMVAAARLKSMSCGRQASCGRLLQQRDRLATLLSAAGRYCLGAARSVTHQESFSDRLRACVDSWNRFGRQMARTKGSPSSRPAERKARPRAR